MQLNAFKVIVYIHSILYKNSRVLFHFNFIFVLLNLNRILTISLLIS